jgi:hypothetical protein
MEPEWVFFGFPEEPVNSCPFVRIRGFQRGFVVGDRGFVEGKPGGIPSI